VRLNQPSNWICKPAYLVPVPSEDKLGGLASKGIRLKNGGMAEMGAPISLDGVTVHLDCWCVCLCYLHFVPENPEDGKKYFWNQLTWVALNKVQRAVKWSCVCYETKSKCIIISFKSSHILDFNFIL